MSYYGRAFCTADDRLPLRTILDWAKPEGVSLEPAMEHLAADLDSPHRREAELRYKRGSWPISVELTRRGDELLSDEIGEFVEFVAAPVGGRRRGPAPAARAGSTAGR
jgi:hypothetical protein